MIKPSYSAKLKIFRRQNPEYGPCKCAISEVLDMLCAFKARSGVRLFFLFNLFIYFFLISFLHFKGSISLKSRHFIIQEIVNKFIYGINTIISKTCLFKYTENFINKKWKFSDKKFWYFSHSTQNIDCGYSLEPPQWCGSNEYPQSMFLSRNKKNNVYPCKPQFYYIKVRFKGVKII